MERVVASVALLIFLFASCVGCVTKVQRVVLSTKDPGDSQKYWPSVAIVKTAPGEEYDNVGSAGTAWAIDKDRLLTAGHVCESYQRLARQKRASSEGLMVLRSDNHGDLHEAGFAEVVKVNSTIDMCLLSKKNHRLRPIKISDKIDLLETEDAVFYVGGPASTLPTRVYGRVIKTKTNEEEYGRWMNTILLSIDVQGGASGSPLIWNGEAIGMIVARTMGSRNLTHGGFAVRSDDLLEFIKSK